MIFSVSSQFSFAIKDIAGTMSPYDAEHLIKGIKDAVGDVPAALHTHCTTGMAYEACGDDVADPWYTDDFETTWRDVLEGCQGLLERLRSREGKPGMGSQYS